ncbi:Na(+)-translocating NADH-quinone reductase subunit A [Trichloromonas sp.]|uniref:Na(+)-translocating NADH-quinone reductase subunit A n=1 Tax=Trichloromonas sp. TaxID=3069249 RepID=UPI002A38AC9A|nr:Na(+)-translocating NADH-quinone reductase subunit A [Trichloromonas sp.]
MRHIRLKQGFDLPLAGAPEQRICDGPAIRRVALLGPDHPGLRPSLAVAEGDRVRLGQPLFCDRRDERIRHTAPGAGRVTAIHRGDKRALLAVEIELGGEEEEDFVAYPDAELDRLGHAQVVENLLASGLWTALRTRPFGKTPLPDQVPDALFVTAIDTQPLAADPRLIIAERPDDFRNGLRVLRHLTDGPLYLCLGPGPEPAVPHGIERVQFNGPHPAGLPGTHIHRLVPITSGRVVWHLGYQDLLAIGCLFTSGRLNPVRVIALTGPGITRPRLVRTRLGASCADLLRNENVAADQRVIAGSVLHGRPAEGPLAFLGRFHLQVCALPRSSGSRPRLSLLNPLRAWLPQKKTYNLDSQGHGTAQAIFPDGRYERVMPFDLMLPYLLRALACGDVEEARALGCLELEEEDLALCSFVCPGKNDFGPMLRAVLEEIEKEG